MAASSCPEELDPEGRTDLALLDYKLTRRIEEIAFSDLYREAVGRLRCFRGIDTHSAIVLLTALGDFRRYRTPVS